jgi:hypothetical protein
MVRMTRLWSTLTGTSGVHPANVRGRPPTVAQPDSSAAELAANVLRSSNIRRHYQLVIPTKAGIHLFSDCSEEQADPGSSPE